MRPVLALALAMALVLAVVPAPSVRASTYGPYDLWYFYWLDGYHTENAYQAYPGGTIFFDYGLVNSQTSGSITITEMQVVTPWQTYADNSLPVTIAQGQEYYGYFAITIPSGQQTGNVTFTATNSATGFSPATDSYTIKIFANPTTLQNQIDTLNSQVTSLQSQVSTLQSQLTTAQNNEASLQSQVSGLQSQLTASEANATKLQQSVNSLNLQLSTAQSQLTNATAKANTLTTQLKSAQADISSKATQISTLQTQLSSTQATLATAGANLATAQGELSTYSSVYLPVGVVVPSIIAILLLVLFMRKGRGPVAGGTARPSQAGTATAASKASDSRFCADCGKEIKADAKFCASCGASL